MDSKTLEKRNDIIIFENYNDNVSVIGFKPSWISEIKSDMKEIYEKKEKKKNANHSKPKK